jgi:hypothetical protein
MLKVENDRKWEPPTPAQAEAGNYYKPTVHCRGLKIKVENPAGTIRKGKGWQTKMVYDYGYIVGSKGVDGDEVDVYLGPSLAFAPMVYVVHQRKAGDWKNYDEDKCMLGFLSEAQARTAYLQHYDDPRFLGPVTTMPFDEFKEKVMNHTGKPTMIKAVPILFLKAHIPAHTRRLPNGKVIQVRAYDNSRRKQAQRDDRTIDIFGGEKGSEPVHQDRLRQAAKRAKAGDRNLDMFIAAEEHGEVPSGRVAYREPTITEPRSEMIQEHKRLVRVLESPSHEDDKVEAKKQRAELEEYEGKASSDEESWSKKFSFKSGNGTWFMVHDGTDYDSQGKSVRGRYGKKITDDNMRILVSMARSARSYLNLDAYDYSLSLSESALMHRRALGQAGAHQRQDGSWVSDITLNARYIAEKIGSKSGLKELAHLIAHETTHAWQEIQNPGYKKYRNKKWDDRPHEQQADRIGDATYRGIIDDLIGQGLLSVSDSSKPLAKSRPVLFVRRVA